MRRKLKSKKAGEFGIIARMKKLSHAVFMVSLLAIGAGANSFARGQAQSAPSPTPAQSAQATQEAQNVYRALLDLYQAAQSMISEPQNNYDQTVNPNYPYPAQMQHQWNVATGNYGNSLTEEQRTVFTACATHLNASIDYSERSYKIIITQKGNTPAEAEAAQLKASAETELKQCDTAYALAQSGVANASSNAAQKGETDANGEKPAPAENPPAEAAPPAENPPVQAAPPASNPPVQAAPPSNPPLVPESPTAANPPTNPPNNGDGSAKHGSVDEAAEPGSIDWTPALDPLFQYLSRQWQKVTTNPKNAGWAPDAAGNSLTLRLQPNQEPEMVSSSGVRKSWLEDIMQNGDIPKTRFPSGSRLSYVTVSPNFQMGLHDQPGRTRTRLKYYERDGVFKSYTVTE